jgi:alcohol dehydrogenase
MTSTLRNLVTHKLAMLWKKNALQYHVAGVEPNGAQLQTILDWIDNGTMKSQLVDRKFHFEHVRDAYQYLEQGHATGKVLLDHGQSESSEFGLQE